MRAVVLVLLAGAAFSAKHEETRLIMGTYVRIIAHSTSPKTAVQKAFDAIERIDRLMSTHREDSEITRLNRFKKLRVSKEFIEVVRKSIEISRLTGGAFDITVEPLVRLWKKAGRAGGLPAEQTLKITLERVGWQNITIADSQITLKNDAEINLGGIAKGYAVDRALEVLRASSVRSALVDAGGDIACFGSPPDQDAWRVGIRDPLHPERVLPTVLLLKDRAVATSGSYIQKVIINGKTYSHIIDPRTGYPVEQAVSATVIARNCTTADALATALSVTPPEDGLRLVHALRYVEAMLITKEGGRLRRWCSGGFSKFEK